MNTTPLKLIIDPPHLELVATEKIQIPPSKLENLDSIEALVSELMYRKETDLPDVGVTIQAAVKILNRNHSIVMFGGKVKIAVETKGQGERDELDFYDVAQWKSFNAHLNAPYMKETANGMNRKEINLAEAFCKSMLAKRFNRVEFNPSVVGDYGKSKNLFKGFPFAKVGYAPCKLSNTIKRDDLCKFVQAVYPKAARFIEHICDNVANGNMKASTQFIAWLADIIQRPERSPMIAVVLRSDEKGTGKSLVGDVVAELVGKNHYFKTNEPQQIIGKFNAHLANALMVVGEEMTWGGSIDVNARIKDIVTSSNISIELKGVDPVMMRKFFRLMLITNSSWAVTASKDERRFLIFDVAGHQKQNDEYFAPLFSATAMLCPKMLKAVFDFLVNVDYSAIDLSKGEQTDAIKEQKLQSMTPLEQWWSHCLDAGEMTIFSKSEGYSSYSQSLITGIRVSKTFVHDAYLSWLDRFKPNSSERLSNGRTFGIQFMKIARGKNKSLIRSDLKVPDGDTRVNGYEFSALEKLHSEFYSNY